MVMRKTPYARLRYPFTSDVVSAADVESMAQDIDQALVITAKQANDFSRFASVTVQRAAAQSLTKNTLTAITFDTITLNNGANSPLANSPWFAIGAPTRLTAPVACVVAVCASGGVNLGSALGTAGCIEVVVGLNGGGNVQGTKYSPTSAVTGQQWASGMSLWKLAATDYLEMKMLWTGTPAGPFSTDTVIPPMLSLMMVSLPSVP